MQDPKTPPQSVIDAFQIIAPLQPLSGGRGLCFLAGDVVMRPVDEPAETQWLGGVLLSLSQLPHANREYRIAKPLQSTSTATAEGEAQFIIEGWSASSFVQGKEGPGGKWAQILTTSRAFHRDLRDLVSEPPAFLALKTDRWVEADRVTWGEKRLKDVLDVNHDILRLISPHLEKLKQVKKPLPVDSLKHQIVHADLTGNVLFDEGSGLAPAIIDISPIWRPVEFAEAVVVVDGLLHHGQGIELIELYGTNELRLQVLVRALYWRILVFAIQSDLAWIKVYMPQTDFEGAVKLVTELVERGKES